MEKRITVISDTHGMHYKLNPEHLIGGDLIIHAGDVSNVGRREEIKMFLKWFSMLDQYKHKVFIAGNHDFFFEQYTKDIVYDVLNMYDGIVYLEDQMQIIDGLKIYGSPWQPEFHNWAFNLPRNGSQLEMMWKQIPTNLDILVTHGPPYGILDTVRDQPGEYLGCEKLKEAMKHIRPAVHTFGHIHDGYGEGYYEKYKTHFINASVLNERYFVINKPVSFIYDTEAKKIKEFIIP